MLDVISYAKALILKLNGSGNKFLADDGTYKEIGGGGLIIDSAMSDSSTNAVQNKVIKKYVDDNSSAVEPSTDLNNALVMGSDNKPYVKNLKPELDDLKLFKFPNATIVGQPTINNGQISGFSADNYLRFPFIVDFKSRPFVIDIEFTTSTDVTTQQNIFDSDFGFAFAVRNSKFVIAMSSDGTSWNLGEAVGTHTVLVNTTYRAELSWDGSVYKVAYSVDGGETYIDDITKSSTDSLYPRQIFIGIGENFGSVLNFFKGSINFNNCSLTISDKVVWQGMDSAGMATRLAVDVSNIDEAGIEKIKEIVGESSSKELTEEHKTGETYNGKPVYEVLATGLSFNFGKTIGTWYPVLPTASYNIDSLLWLMLFMKDSQLRIYPAEMNIFNGYIQAASAMPSERLIESVLIKYTKTTD